MALKYFKLTLYLIDESSTKEPVVDNYTIKELLNDLDFDLPQLAIKKKKAEELTESEFRKEIK